MPKNMSKKKKGTFTAKQEQEAVLENIKKISQEELEPNELLSQFILDNGIDFQVAVFEDKYVHIPGRGFLFFSEPQLIYKATKKSVN